MAERTQFCSLLGRRKFPFSSPVNKKASDKNVRGSLVVPGGGLEPPQDMLPQDP